MSKITIEQIDIVRNRANVGYKEAKETLEKFDGDVVETILYLEENEKLRPDIKRANMNFFCKCKDFLKKLNNIDIEVYKKDKVALKMPSTILIIAAIIAFPFVAVGAVIGLFSGYKLRINNNNENKTYTKVDDIVNIDITKK